MIFVSTRYLEGYEKLYFLGEDGDELSSPRVSMYNLGSYGSPQMPVMYKGMHLKSLSYGYWK
jgi:hypothetical protein